MRVLFVASEKFGILTHRPGRLSRTEREGYQPSRIMRDSGYVAHGRERISSSPMKPQLAKSSPVERTRNCCRSSAVPNCCIVRSTKRRCCAWVSCKDSLLTSNSERRFGSCSVERKNVTTVAKSSTANGEGGASMPVVYGSPVSASGDSDTRG